MGEADFDCKIIAAAAGEVSISLSCLPMFLFLIDGRLSSIDRLIRQSPDRHQHKQQHLYLVKGTLSGRG